MHLDTLVKQLLWVQLWSGAPLYLLASVAMGVWLHHCGRFKLVSLVVLALLCTAVTVVASVLFWVRVLGPVDVMVLGAVNLPALVCCLVIFPVIGGLCLAASYAKQ